MPVKGKAVWTVHDIFFVRLDFVEPVQGGPIDMFSGLFDAGFPVVPLYIVLSVGLT